MPWRSTRKARCSAITGAPSPGDRPGAAIAKGARNVPSPARPEPTQGDPQATTALLAPPRTRAAERPGGSGARPARKPQSLRRPPLAGRRRGALGGHRRPLADPGERLPGAPGGAGPGPGLPRGAGQRRGQRGQRAAPGGESRRILPPLFPGWPAEEMPVGHVTNGVHVPSWDSAAADALWTQPCGKGRWLGALEA
jgi:hypothetical protein